MWQVLWLTEFEPPAPRDSVSEVVGVPVDDNPCREIEPGDPEAPAPVRPIADLTPADNDTRRESGGDVAPALGFDRRIPRVPSDLPGGGGVRASDARPIP